MFDRKMLEEEILLLSSIKENIEKEQTKLVKKIPEGGLLRAAKHRSSVQYYYRKNGNDKCGKYIKKKNRTFAECLAQMEYDKALLKVIDDEIAALTKLQETSFDNPFSLAIEKINPLKRELILQEYLSDEDYINKWVTQDYYRMDFKEDALEFYTKKGLRVRSKSEIIIAEMLDRYDIPYLYEKPLCFDSGKVVHPDFTLLNVKERKEIIWEHFGMMDDADYRNKAFAKIREYETNGFYQGLNFICTMETGRFPINTKSLDNMVQRVFEV